MTETDELRKLLDERGVEWRDEYNGFEYITAWHANGIYANFSEDKGLAEPNLLTVYHEDLTPSQAIAATLSDNDATRARQLDAIDEILRTLNAEVTNDNIKYDLYSELHDMVGELANLIEESLNSESSLNEPTCKRVLYKPTGAYVCSECGLGLSKKLDKYCFLRYCPNCGRRIEADE